MDKSNNNEPGFSFAKLAGTENYKKWARKMRYSLESARLCNHILTDTKNPKPAPIILKDEDLKDDIKLKCQEKHVDKIHA